MLNTDMLKKTAFAGLLAAAMIVPAAANAETVASGVTQEHFAQADKDGSGTLTEAEYDVFVDTQEDADVDVASDFNDLDINNDEVLTVAEFRAQQLDR